MLINKNMSLKTQAAGLEMSTLKSGFGQEILRRNSPASAEYDQTGERLVLNDGSPDQMAFFLELLLNLF